MSFFPNRGRHGSPASTFWIFLGRGAYHPNKVSGEGPGAAHILFQKSPIREAWIADSQAVSLVAVCVELMCHILSKDLNPKHSSNVAYYFQNMILVQSHATPVAYSGRPINIYDAGGSPTGPYAQKSSDR
jgi:hypothetical protein